MQDACSLAIFASRVASSSGSRCTYGSMHQTREAPVLTRAYPAPLVDPLPTSTILFPSTDRLTCANEAQSELADLIRSNLGQICAIEREIATNPL